MQDALKLIIANSPAAGADAMQCLRAIDADSPMVQQRYNRVVEIAFSDRMADFTPAQRAIIASHVEAVGGNDGAATRSKTLRVRLSNDEFATVQDDARAAGGVNLSDYVRARLGL